MDVDFKPDATTPSTVSEIPPVEWEKHKQFIHHLYVNQRRPLKDVQRKLAEDHGFSVPAAQLKQRLRAWKFRKNTPSIDMDRIVEDLIQNNAKLISEPQPDQNIQSHGRQVRLSQVKRYMRRNHSPARSNRTAPTTPWLGASKGGPAVDCDADLRTHSLVTDAFSANLLSASLPDLDLGLVWDQSIALDDEPIEKDAIAKTGETGYEKLLACPFAKFDPMRYTLRNAEPETPYRRCSALVLRNISALKQHLYRIHKRPDYYCPFCYAEFPVQHLRDQHARARDCEIQPSDPFKDKMTDEQSKRIKRRRAAADTHEAWYEIYGILFPGHRRPASPYVSEDQGAVMHLFNVFQALGPMASELYEKLCGEDSTDHLAAPLPVQTQLVMDEAFDRFKDLAKNQDHRQRLGHIRKLSATSAMSTRQSSLASGEIYSLFEQPPDDAQCWTAHMEAEPTILGAQSADPLDTMDKGEPDWAFVNLERPEFYYADFANLGDSNLL